MSVTVGHSITGLILFTVMRRFQPDLGLPSRGLLLLLVVLANLPDLDFLPVLLWDAPSGTTHRTVTHALPFALMVGLALAWAIRRCYGKPVGWLWMFLPLAILSHDMLDMLCVDPVPPAGVQFLWPFSDAFFNFPLPFMLSAGHYDGLNLPVWQVIVAAAPRELMIFGGLYLLVSGSFWLWDRYGTKSRQSARQRVPY